MATDNTGIPLNICISGGQSHETKHAIQLVKNIGIKRKSGQIKHRPKAVIGDKGYTGEPIRNYLKKRGIKVVIPYRSNEKANKDKRKKIDYEHYKQRNAVERCFNFLKEHRSVATRSDKTARNYLAMVKLSAIRLFLRRLLN